MGSKACSSSVSHSVAKMDQEKRTSSATMDWSNLSFTPPAKLFGCSKLKKLPDTSIHSQKYMNCYLHFWAHSCQLVSSSLQVFLARCLTYLPNKELSPPWVGVMSSPVVCANASRHTQWHIGQCCAYDSSMLVVVKSYQWHWCSPGSSVLLLFEEHVCDMLVKDGWWL